MVLFRATISRNKMYPFYWVLKACKAQTWIVQCNWPVITATVSTVSICVVWLCVSLRRNYYTRRVALRSVWTEHRRRFKGWRRKSWCTSAIKPSWRKRWRDGGTWKRGREDREEEREVATFEVFLWTLSGFWLSATKRQRLKSVVSAQTMK